MADGNAARRQRQSSLAESESNPGISRSAVNFGPESLVYLCHKLMAELGRCEFLQAGTATLFFFRQPVKP